MMKRILVLVLVFILVMNVSYAMQVELTNGEVRILASGLSENEGEEELRFSSFYLLGRDEDGSYVIYVDGKLYKAQADQLKYVVPELGDIPRLGTIETLTKGARGEAVVPLQRKLISLGYLSSYADGDYGANTESALIAFQESYGFEMTGIADELTQLMIDSLTSDPVVIETPVDPEVMFAPLSGRTDIDIQVFIDNGLMFDYDDINDEGFISAGVETVIDFSGEADLDKYVLTVDIGLLAHAGEAGTMNLSPAIRLSCLCVRRPMMSTVSIKAGNERGSAAVEDLRASLEGVYTVESGSAILDESMSGILSNASDAGEFKLRIEGKYQTFDVEFEKSSLDAISLIGNLLQQ